VLILSDRLSRKDIAMWEQYETADLLWFHTHKIQPRIERAVLEIQDFYSKGPCYLGVSWGKDSVTVAHLVALSGCDIPFVWVRVEPIKNPECLNVRDEFLSQYPQTKYDEIITHRKRDFFGSHTKRTLGAGFKEAYRKYGKRHISGVRSEESGIRKISRFTHGISSANACRPIIDWRHNDVFAYLAHNDLPVHPSYAMLGGGRWEREHLRVASLGGKRGDQFGRTIWEKEYYSDILRRTGQL